MGSAASFLTDLAASGRSTFTTGEALAQLGGSLVALRAALRRLKAKGAIADPYRGFHVLVPPEYRRLGCLPPEQFLPQLMEHLGERYYVALLSAAELHGAAHQRPQEFQVMVERNRRSIECGAVRVQFVARRDLASTAVVAKNTPRGTLVVAAPEATALELVGYADRCGGLGIVVTVLLELVEVVEPEKLLLAARSCPIAWTQRLGYLLERIEQGALAAVLESLVAESARVVARLLPSVPAAGAERDVRWRLAVNATVEPDA